MPELLDELSIARSGGELKKCPASYKKVDLLILDEWLIHPLSPQESYDLLEIVELRNIAAPVKQGGQGKGDGDRQLKPFLRDIMIPPK